MRDWILYSIARVAVFFVPLAVLLAIGLEWWVAALIAATLGLCVSYIFLRPLRDRVTAQLAARRDAPAPTRDEDAEDAA